MRTIISEKRLRAMLEQQLRETNKKDVKISATKTRLTDFFRGSGINRLRLNNITGQYKLPSGNSVTVNQALQSDTRATFSKTIGSGGTEIGAFFEDFSDNPLSREMINLIKDVFQRNGKYIINSNDLKNNSPFSDLIVGVSESFYSGTGPVIGSSNPNECDIYIDTITNTIDLSSMYLVSLKATSNVKKGGGFYDPLGNAKIKGSTIIQLIDTIYQTYIDAINDHVDLRRPVKIKARVGIMTLVPVGLVNDTAYSLLTQLNNTPSSATAQDVYNVLSNSIVSGEVNCKFINDDIYFENYSLPGKDQKLTQKGYSEGKFFESVGSATKVYIGNLLDHYKEAFINKLASELSGYPNLTNFSMAPGEFTSGRKTIQTIDFSYQVIQNTSVLTSILSECINHACNAVISPLSFGDLFSDILKRFFSSYIPLSIVSSKNYGKLYFYDKEIKGSPQDILLRVPLKDNNEFIEEQLSIPTTPTSSPESRGSLSADNFLTMFYMMSQSSVSKSSSLRDPSSVYKDVRFYIGFNTLAEFLGVGTAKIIGRSVISFLGPYLDSKPLIDLFNTTATDLEKEIVNPLDPGSFELLDAPLEELSSEIELFLNSIAEYISKVIFAERDPESIDAQRRSIKVIKFVTGQLKHVRKAIDKRKNKIKEGVLDSLREATMTNTRKFLDLLINDLTNLTLDPHSYDLMIDQMMQELKNQNPALIKFIKKSFEKLNQFINKSLVFENKQKSKSLYNNIVKDIMETANKKRKM